MKRYVVRYTVGDWAGNYLPVGNQTPYEGDMADARVFRGTGPAHSSARYSLKYPTTRAERNGTPPPEYDLIEVELVRVDR